MEPAGSEAARPPIELGWITVGELPPSEDHALRAARENVGKRLETWFPDFAWRLPVVPRPTAPAALLDEPAVRLYEGVQERDAQVWDFALVVTPRDLQSHYKSHALAVPSRALAVAVLSTARLAPADAGPETLARRVEALVLHLFGDLNGLPHRDDPDAVMQAPRVVTDLDRERDLDARELETLGAALEEVADLRLEETPTHPERALPFYLRASRERAGEIASAVWQARPWELPFRLSRLTAAAFSALFILLVTAEVWDLGTSQRPPAVVALSVLVVLGTTAFIVTRQKLILRRARHPVSEQTVVMHVSAALIVLLGMLTTYAILFALTLGIGLTLFDPALIGRWAPEARAEGILAPLLVMSGLVSSLGLLIGSLGASFEGHHYFRHVIYADEET